MKEVLFLEEYRIFGGEDLMPPAMFDEMFSIIERSFPPDERRKKAEHLAEFNSGFFRSLCLCGEKLVGFLNFWDLDDFVYIEHFAVDPSFRGNGTGTAIMNKALELNQGRLKVLEAEPPELSEIAFRRIAFYKRLGFIPNPNVYWQPPITSGEPPVKLSLLSTPTLLTQGEYSAIQAAIYREVYKVPENWTPSD